MDVKKKRKVIGILLISLGFFILLSLVHFTPEDPHTVKVNEIKNEMGLVGSWIAYIFIKKTIGYASITLALLIMIWGLNFLLKNKIKPIKKITLYTVLFSLYFANALAFLGMIKASSKVNEANALTFQLDHQQWGLIGGVISQYFYNFFGTAGTIILFPTIVIITLLYALDIKFEKVKSKILPRFTKFIAKISLRYDPRKFKPKKQPPSIRDILKSKKKPEPASQEFEFPLSDVETEFEPALVPEPAVPDSEDMMFREKAETEPVPKEET
ncbi:MAG: DNA translocase FtsK 4TM domain-containing protein, partial [bacterium]